jgi:hypothetical protein
MRSLDRTMVCRLEADHAEPRRTIRFETRVPQVVPASVVIAASRWEMPLVFPV